MQKVAVLGLGLNGLISSIVSKKCGLDVKIFEGGSLEGYKEDRRTSVLTFESVEFFKEIGLEGILPMLSPINHIYTFEGKEKPVLSFDSGEPFGYVIFNFQFKEFLLNEIHKLQIPIINEMVVAEKGEVLLPSGKSEKFHLILNCKGKGQERAVFHSSYNQKAFVFNISHTKNHNKIAVESFTPEGPLAILPLKEETQSAVIWCVSETSGEFLESVSESKFLEYFKKEATRMGHIGEVQSILGEKRQYSLSISFAKSQVKEKMILLGDCFNAIHPVAGSSFNMSVKDIKNLRNNLQESLSLGLEIGSKAQLEAFKRANIRHHIEMNLMTHSLVKLFSNPNPALKFARNFGLEVVESLPFIKKLLIKRASGL